MPDYTTAQLDKLRQAIAALETQQRDLGLDLTVHITELYQRLGEVGGIAQSGSGATAASGGVAAGERGAAVGGDVAGPRRPSCRRTMAALGDYHRLYQFRIDVDYDLLPLNLSSAEECMSTAEGTIAEIARRAHGGNP